MLDVGTELGSLIGALEEYNNGKLDGSLDYVSLGQEYGTALGSSDGTTDVREIWD